MSAELLPELYRKIHKEFENQISKNESVQKFYKNLQEEKATSEDVSAFSGDIGECASNALCKYLTEDVFTDGLMDPVLADETIKRLLIEVHQIVMDAAIAVQELEDKKLDINLNPLKSDFPTERVDDLINKLISILKRNE